MLRRLSSRVAFAALLLAFALVHVDDTSATPGDHVWSESYGSGGQQLANSVAVDRAGNVVITGEFSGSVDFGGGAHASVGTVDVFTAKFDGAGNYLWSHRYGSAGSTSGQSVAVDGLGNVIVAGYFDGEVNFGGSTLTSAGQRDIFLAKFDSAGNHLWSKQFGDDANQQAHGVAVDNFLNIVLTGGMEGAANFGNGDITSAGNFDVFVVRLDSGGNHVFSKRFGDGFDQVGLGVAVDVDSAATVTGWFMGTMNFGGSDLSAGTSTRDIFVARFDSGGNHVWSKEFGDSSTQSGRGVAVDRFGLVAVTGDFEGSVNFGVNTLTSAGADDMFLARLDTAGNEVWSKRFGNASGPGAQAWENVTVDRGSNVTLTGNLLGSADFGGGTLTGGGGLDIVVARYDANGNHLWSKVFGGTGNQRSQSIAAADIGAVVVAGYFAGSIDFGDGTLSSNGGDDIYVAKLVGCGPTNIGLGAPDAAGDCETALAFPNVLGDGCVDDEEAALGISNTSPWDFYSVPIPTLFSAANPLIVFRDADVTAADAQAIFAYATNNAIAGSIIYEQDLNNNGVKDGREYDRTAPSPPGPPDGAVTAADAQLAFVQATAAFGCTSGYNMQNSP